MQGGFDDGTWLIPFQGAPGVTLRNHNGDNQDRSLCLTSGAGEAAAWQCGDLLVAHGLPGYATMGRERSLTLVYGSAQAVPRPIVAAVVNETYLAPTTVFVRLQFGGVTKDSATYTGWGVGTAPYTRQIVLPHAANGDSSGIYAFTLKVQNQYAGGAYETAISDTLIVVNRGASRFGTGWSLAGVEELRLSQPGNKVLWIGGDGSAKVYRNVGTNVWLAAAGAFRDTLRYDPGTLTYSRTLRHGIQVKFNAAGRHVQTVNRVGQVTTFTWSTNGDTLKSITVPPGVSGTTYTLTYASGKLDKITDPAGRVLDVAVVSSRLTQIIDPDTTVWHTDFGYDASGRMIGRTNRRGFTTRFAYANNLRVTRDSIPVDSAPASFGVTLFQPWDEKGVAPTNGATGLVAVDTGLAYTKIDGPRTNAADTAEFWVDLWGAPVKIRDPLGFETNLKRGDPNRPALVTRVQYPDGRVLGSGYDGRGNVTFIADSTYEGSGTTQVATTSFLYGDAAAPDSPTKVRTPVDTTTIAYHDSLGVPDTITAQGGHKTVFAYLLTPATKRGLLMSVTELSVRVVDTTAWTKSNQDLVTSFTYDTFGNDSTITSPKNAVSRYEYDAFRRVIRAFDPLNHVTVYAYDRLNRPVAVTVLDPDSLKTRYFYSRTGMLDSILDPRNVIRSWRYDAADEPVRLIDEMGDTAKQYFGPSGLVDSLRTRNGQVIAHRYDAAGQLLATTYPQMLNHFSADSSQDATIPGDSIVRAYDQVGRLVLAVTGKDTVTRTYNREGTIRTERQLVRSITTGALLSDFTVRYWYDAGGRRAKFFNGTDTLRYTYGTDGLVSRLVVQWMPATIKPDTFRFYWDGVGRRDSVVYARPGANQSFGYDRDGNLRLVCSRHWANASALDYLEHRVRYEALNGDGAVLTYHRYLGGTDSPVCGALPANYTVEGATYQYDARHEMLSDGTLTFKYDASGNRISTRSGANFVDSLVYTAASNRLWITFRTPDSVNKYFEHDRNGSRTIEGPWCFTCNWRVYYYNSVGQMTGHKYFLGGHWYGGSQRCWYDGLGRRVRGCDDGETSGGWAGFDGDNVIRLTGGISWRFVHGPGTDDPLAARLVAGGSNTLYYYLTDGRGRHLAFTDSLGTNRNDDVVYYQNGGNQAGSIDRSNGFSNTRAETPSAPQLSFYRNRYYDQQTGRFTQEDPADIAGGINLYQYVGNSPVLLTDPFGLRICLEARENHPEDIEELKGALERATGTSITLDANNCVVDYSIVTRKGFEIIQAIFQGLVHAKEIFTIRISNPVGGEEDLATGHNAVASFNRSTRRGEIVIGLNLLRTAMYPYMRLPGVCFPIPKARATLSAILVHELIGHESYGIPYGGVSPQAFALRMENLYHVAVGERKRCGG